MLAASAGKKIHVKLRLKEKKFHSKLSATQNWHFSKTTKKETCGASVVSSVQSRKKGCFDKKNDASANDWVKCDFLASVWQLKGFTRRHFSETSTIPCGIWSGHWDLSLQPCTCMSGWKRKSSAESADTTTKCEFCVQLSLILWHCSLTTWPPSFAFRSICLAANTWLEYLVSTLRCTLL